ncbi:hypothetical protein MJ579_08945 [Klebsiella pneumoniae]|nr:hypothetical protein MJ579_08945 [Klebsiella pneumoniae]
MKKLSPMVQWRNPVMFIVWVGSLLTTLLAIAMAGGAPDDQRHLYRRRQYLAVVYGNVRQLCRSDGGRPQQPGQQPERGEKTAFAANCAPRSMTRRSITCRREDLRKGDVVLVLEAGDIIPCDGEVIETAPRWTAPLPASLPGDP